MWRDLPFHQLDSWELKTAFAGVFTASRTTQAAFRSACMPTHTLCVPPPSSRAAVEDAYPVSPQVAHVGCQPRRGASCLSPSRWSFAVARGRTLMQRRCQPLADLLLAALRRPPVATTLMGSVTAWQRDDSIRACQHAPCRYHNHVNHAGLRRADRSAPPKVLALQGDYHEEGLDVLTALRGYNGRHGLEFRREAAPIWQHNR